MSKRREGFCKQYSGKNHDANYFTASFEPCKGCGKRSHLYFLCVKPSPEGKNKYNENKLKENDKANNKTNLGCNITSFFQAIQFFYHQIYLL